MKTPTPLLVNGILTSSFEFTERLCASMTHNRVQLIGITSPDSELREQIMRLIMNRFIRGQDEDFSEVASALLNKMVAEGYTDDNNYVPANAEVESYPLDDVKPRGDYVPISFNSLTYYPDGEPFTQEDVVETLASNKFLTVIHKDVNFFLGIQHQDFYDFNHYHISYANKG